MAQPPSELPSPNELAERLSALETNFRVAYRGQLALEGTVEGLKLVLDALLDRLRMSNEEFVRALVADMKQQESLFSDPKEDHPATAETIGWFRQRIEELLPPDGWAITPSG